MMTYICDWSDNKSVINLAALLAYSHKMFGASQHKTLVLLPNVGTETVAKSFPIPNTKVRH